MNYWVTYPLTTHPYNPELTTKAGLTRFCEVAEAAGFAGIGFTDHPAPTQKWLKAGGHDALDPFAALSFCAAVTDRMRLIPNIVVLPYRNPFLVAKAAATLDALSDGRFTLAVATGYMRGEYQALGVDFDQRNALFDEAIEVIRGVWSEDEFAHQGTTFTAGDRRRTRSPRRIRRSGSAGTAASPGNGWPATPMAGARFPPPESGQHRQDTAARVRGRSPPDARRALAVHGGRGARPRQHRCVVRFQRRGGPGHDTFDPDAQLAATEELAAIGVTWSGVGVPGDSLAHALETLERFGTSVIR